MSGACKWDVISTTCPYCNGVGCTPLVNFSTMESFLEAPDGTRRSEGE